MTGESTRATLQQFLVLLKQKLYPLALVVELPFSVAGINGLVQGVVGVEKIGRHEAGIVEIGKGTVREFFAKVQDGLGG